MYLKVFLIGLSTRDTSCFPLSVIECFSQRTREQNLACVSQQICPPDPIFFRVLFYREQLVNLQREVLLAALVQVHLELRNPVESKMTRN